MVLLIAKEKKWELRLSLVPTWIFLGFSILLWILFLFITSSEFRQFKKKFELKQFASKEEQSVEYERSMLESSSC